MLAWIVAVYVGVAVALLVVLLVKFRGIPPSDSRDVLWLPAFWPFVVLHMVIGAVFRAGRR